jgi:hypothetical protein
MFYNPVPPSLPPSLPSFLLFPFLPPFLPQVTDVKTGPDGYLYVADYSGGKLYR